MSRTPAKDPRTPTGRWLVKLLGAHPRGTTLTAEQETVLKLVRRLLPIIEDEARRGPAAALEPIDVCNALAQWAVATGQPTTLISKSDLLSRLIYGRERGPSQTPCPVHQGKWSGCHVGWPGQEWQSADGTAPIDTEPKLQEWWDAGCRCATHTGSSCTTGWNPDEHCCLQSSDHQVTSKR